MKKMTKNAASEKHDATEKEGGGGGSKFYFNIHCYFKYK